MIIQISKDGFVNVKDVLFAKIYHDTHDILAEDCKTMIRKDICSVTISYFDGYEVRNECILTTDDVAKARNLIEELKEYQKGKDDARVLFNSEEV